jgi:hypothetical protein
LRIDKGEGRGLRNNENNFWNCEGNYTIIGANDEERFEQLERLAEQKESQE